MSAGETSPSFEPACDEQNYVTVRADYVDCVFKLFLQRAAILGSCHKRAYVERKHGFAFQQFGHRAVHDCLGKPLYNRALAHARLADEHRVIFGLSAKYLDYARNFLAPADYRVDFMFSCAARYVRAHVCKLPGKLMPFLVALALRVVRFLLQYRFQLFREFGQVELVPISQYARCQRSLVKQHAIQKMLGSDGGLSETLRQLEARLKHRLHSRSVVDVAHDAHVRSAAENALGKRQVDAALD